VPFLPYICAAYIDKIENKIFLKYKEIQSGAVGKSYIRKGFLIYEEMRKYSLKDIVQPKKRGVERDTIRTILTSYTIVDIFFEHLKG
jgi:hypothetical protein